MLSPKIRKKRSASIQTLDQWRQDKALVKAARLTLENEILADMLAVVDNASPLNANLSFGAHVSEHDHSRQLGRIEGYAMALRTLESLGTLKTVQREPPPTYSAPQE